MMKTIAAVKTGLGLSIAAAVLASAGSASAQVVFASGVPGVDVAFDGKGKVKAAYVASGGGIVRIACNGGSCVAGTPTAILPSGALGNTTWGVALDNKGDLYVAAGANGFDDAIYRVPAAATCAPTWAATAFATGFANLRSMGTGGQTLYAADFGSGGSSGFRSPIRKG